MNGWPVFEIAEKDQVFMNMDSDNEEQGQNMGIDNLEDVKDAAAVDEEEDYQPTTAKAGDKWKDDLDVDFSDEEEDQPQVAVQATDGASSGGAFISKENQMVSFVRKNSNIASEFAAVGLFKEALEKLETQIGMKKQDVVAKQFTDLYLCSELFYSTMNFIPTHSQFLTPTHNPGLPLVANNLKAAEKKLKHGYKKTTEGNFEDAIEVFRDILISIPLLSLNSKSDVASAHKLIEISTEYIVALSCDSEKKKTSKVERQLELTIIMALPNLHPTHRVLTLRAAMAMAFKTKNFIIASYIARRFIKLAADNEGLVEQDVLIQAQKILAKSEKTGTNEFNMAIDEQLLHDAEVIGKIDAKALVIIGKSDEVKLCPLDKAHFKAKAAGQVCSVCLTCEIGKETIGMKITR